jgi:hypothetical protein
MLAAAGFFLGELSLAALGAGAAFHPSVRSMGLAARAAAAMGAGAVALTLEATLYSTVGIPWTVPGLGIPLLLLSILSALWWRGRPTPARSPIRIPRGIAVCSASVCALSLSYLALSFLSSSATSVDFLFFWGVKAARFAEVRGFDAGLLRNPFFIHAVPDYPPLVPVIEAWGCLAARRMPWRAVPAASALWVAAAAPLLFERFRRRLGDGAAASLAAFWTATLSVSLAYSYSGGNAEAPLVFFESVGLAWLLTEEVPWESRFFPWLVLCGAALTKVEGFAAVVFLAGGSFLKERGPLPVRSRRSLALVAWPAVCVGLWFFYQASRSLSIGYRAHGELLGLFPRHLGRILPGMLRNLDAGSLWLPWLFAILWLAAPLPAWRAAAPALVLAIGILAFLLFDYMHDTGDPTERIGWTAPRVAQPALSAAVLAAGASSARRKRRMESAVAVCDAFARGSSRVECGGSARANKGAG